MELADFTSGLPELPDEAPRNLEWRGIGTHAMPDFLAWLSRTAPDTGCDLPAPYLYSNASVGLLGPILANVAGRRWTDLVSARITGRLLVADQVRAEAPRLGLSLMRAIPPSDAR